MPHKVHPKTFEGVARNASLSKCTSDKQQQMEEDEEDDEDDDDNATGGENEEGEEQVEDSTVFEAKEKTPYMERTGSRRKLLRAPSVATSSVASFSLRTSTSGFRLKRAFLVGRRGGPSTPVPSWKVSDVGLPDSSRADDDSLEHHHHHRLDQRIAVSARKLAASLWELQEVPFSKGGPSRAPTKGHLQQQQQIQLHQNASLADKHAIQQGQFLSPASSRASNRLNRSASIQTKIRTPRSSVYKMKKTLRDVASRSTTTHDLMQVLTHVRTLEEQHTSSMSLVDALRGELDQARSQLQDLLFNEKAYRKEFENMKRSIAHERALWREQQDESMRVAVRSIRQELEEEKMSKQRLELLHKRVVRDLHNVKKLLGKALQDVDKERKARELMEDVCDELAKEIGEDKARVEELKRESVKVREEVEEERKMLQMAEIWREERVQMKLMEAKLELEEKNAALDKLRSELEAFLKAKRAGDQKDEKCKVDARIDTRRHSIDAILGRNLRDSFHATDSRGASRSSAESGSLGRHPHNLVELGNDGSDYGDDAEDLQSSGRNKGSSFKPESNYRRERSSQEHDIWNRGRRSMDQRVVSIDKSKLWGVESSQVLERASRNQISVEGMGGDRDVSWGDSLESVQWIDRSIEGGEMRDCRQGYGQDDLWESEKDDSQGHISFSPKRLGRNLRSRSGTPGSSGIHGNSMFGQLSNAPSSPTCKWNHYWSSPDRGNPHPKRPSNASSDMSKSIRGSNLKEKLWKPS